MKQTPEMVFVHIKDKVILETFHRWVRTSANFEEVPWLIIEPKVSIIPSAWNVLFQALFSQRKVSKIILYPIWIIFLFFLQIREFIYGKPDFWYDSRNFE